ncbi:MAG TPA: serine hydrolase domain-containing protein [Candidatus Cybelea sp.]|jgi:CubicO group peptidase (beta-lactamase class C family)
MVQTAREPFARVEAALRPGHGDEFTGAVARIEHRGRVVFEGAYGTTRDDAQARQVYCDTRFDLASLTKLFVATLALQLVAQNRLSLDDPLWAVLPEWKIGRHAAITARMLLAHDSGMNSGADYRAILNENVERFALTTPLLRAPGDRVIYSDLGFIALGVAIERIAARSLDSLVRAAFGGTVAYRPSPRERLVIPATEEDSWRGRVQGLVHDEKAHLMGGAAGHAGLFGSAAAVAAMTESYLAPFAGRVCALLPEPLAREAVSEQAYDSTLRRALGWALKTNDENSCGRWMDASSFGHTGFVGTCVWADPVRDVQGVLLTNGVYFGRDATPSAERSLRLRFYEAMIQDLGLK